MRKVPKFDRIPHPKAWLPVGVFSIILAIVAGLVGHNSGLLKSQFELSIALNQGGNAFTNALSVFASEAYSPKFAVAITAATMLIIWVSRKSWFDAVAFGAVVAFGWLPAQPLKLMFDEPRGDISLLANQVMPLETDSSFPSGHVCFAISFGFALFLLARGTRAQWVAVTFWFASIALEIWARIYVGAHYLNDVVGSLFTATFGILLFAYIWNKWFSELLQESKFYRG